MAKKYNLFSKSDMRRFSRDLEKSVKKQASDAIKNSLHEFTCPNCNRKLQVHVGANTCPYCGQRIDLKFDA